MDRHALYLRRVLCRMIAVALSSALLIQPVAGQAPAGSIYERSLIPPAVWSRVLL